MRLDLYFLDAAALALLILSFYKGFKSGLLNQGIWLVSFLAAYVIASQFCYDLVKLVDIEIVSERLTLVLSFVVIFLVTIAITRGLGKWVTRAMNFTPVGPLNALLGGLLNALLYVAALLVIVNVGLISIPKLDKYLERTLTLDPVVEVEKRVMDSRIAKKVFDVVDDLGK